MRECLGYLRFLKYQAYIMATMHGNSLLNAKEHCVDIFLPETTTWVVQLRPVNKRTGGVRLLLSSGCYRVVGSKGQASLQRNVGSVDY